jgi:hypothetical protein
MKQHLSRRRGGETALATTTCTRVGNSTFDVRLVTIKEADRGFGCTKSLADPPTTTATTSDTTGIS